MTRLIVRLMICSALGVITTVLLAWSCALGPDPSWPDERLRGYLHWDGDGHLWRVHLLQRRGSVELFSASSPFERRRPRRLLEQLQAGTWIPEMTLLADEAIPHWSRFHRTLNDAELAELRTVWHEHAYGWPMLSLGFRTENDHQRRDSNGKLLNQPRPLRTIDAIVTTPSTPILRRWEYLPIGIIWRGLLLDSGLYATIWLALLFVPRPLRRMIRRQRGFCIKCGYDLRGELSTGCPECGWRREAVS